MITFYIGLNIVKYGTKLLLTNSIKRFMIVLDSSSTT